MKNNDSNLKIGTKVVNKEDGTVGTIVGICTFRRNGSDVWSYTVQTSDGTEIWEAGQIFVPE